MVEKKYNDVGQNKARKKGEVELDPSFVNINGVMYAVGLLWQPLQDPDAPFAEIRLMCESEPDFNLYCLRTGAASQYGLGKKALQQASGMPVLAVSVAAYFSDAPSFCAVFKVPEGWWLLVVRNNLILSEQDILFKTEEEAKSALQSILKIPDWDKIIAPDDWQIADSVMVDLEMIVAETRKVRLLDISSPQKTQMLIVVAVILVIGLASLLFYFNTHLDSLDVKVVNDVSPIKVPVKKDTHNDIKPWTKIVRLEPFVSACWNDIFMLKSIIIPNWKMGDISCSAEGVKTSWSPVEKGRNMALFESAIEMYKLEKVKIELNKDGTQATWKIPLDNLPLTNIESALSVEDLEHALIDFQQGTGISLGLNKETISVITELGETPDKNVTQVFTYFSFTINSDYTPWDWMPFFTRFKGLELRSITYRVNNQQSGYSEKRSSRKNFTSKGGAVGKNWQFEGRIYAK